MLAPSTDNNSQHPRFKVGCWMANNLPVGMIITTFADP
jgi:hypothetical protein